MPTAGAGGGGLAGPASTAAQTDRVRSYRAISLGDLGGGVTQAAAVNNRGQVIGQSFTGRFTHPFRWERETHDRPWGA
jgi:hypothetical protein